MATVIFNIEDEKHIFNDMPDTWTELLPEDKAKLLNAKLGGNQRFISLPPEEQARIRQGIITKLSEKETPTETRVMQKFPEAFKETTGEALHAGAAGFFRRLVPGEVMGIRGNIQRLLAAEEVPPAEWPALPPSIPAPAELQRPIASRVGQTAAELTKLVAVSGLTAPLAPHIATIYRDAAPWVARTLPRAIQSGITFGTVDLLNESARQMTEGKFDPNKLVSETAKGTVRGMGIGGLSGLAGTVPRILATGGFAGAVSALNSYVEKGEVDPIDVLFNTALVSTFTAINAPRVTRQIREHAIRELERATEARILRSSPQVSPEVAKSAARNFSAAYQTEFARVQGRMPTTGELENAISKIMDGWKIYVQAPTGTPAETVIKPELMRVIAKEIMPADIEAIRAAAPAITRPPVMPPAVPPRPSGLPVWGKMPAPTPPTPPVEQIEIPPSPEEAKRMGMEGELRAVEKKFQPKFDKVRQKHGIWQAIKGKVYIGSLKAAGYDPNALSKEYGIPQMIWSKDPQAQSLDSWASENREIFGITDENAPMADVAIEALKDYAMSREMTDPLRRAVTMPEKEGIIELQAELEDLKQEIRRKYGQEQGARLTAQIQREVEEEVDNTESGQVIAGADKELSLSPEEIAAFANELTPQDIDLIKQSIEQGLPETDFAAKAIRYLEAQKPTLKEPSEPFTATITVGDEVTVKGIEKPVKIEDIRTETDITGREYKKYFTKEGWIPEHKIFQKLPAPAEEQELPNILTIDGKKFPVTYKRTDKGVLTPVVPVDAILNTEHGAKIVGALARKLEGEHKKTSAEEALEQMKEQRQAEREVQHLPLEKDLFRPGEIKEEPPAAADYSVIDKAIKKYGKDLRWWEYYTPEAAQYNAELIPITRAEAEIFMESPVSIRERYKGGTTQVVSRANVRGGDTSGVEGYYISRGWLDFAGRGWWKRHVNQDEAWELHNLYESIVDEIRETQFGKKAEIFVPKKKKFERPSHMISGREPQELPDVMYGGRKFVRGRPLSEVLQYTPPTIGEKQALTLKTGKGIKKVKEDLFQYAEKQEEAGNLPALGGEDTSRPPRRYYREIQRFPAPKAQPKNQEELDDYVASVFSPIRKSRSEEFYIAITDRNNRLIKAIFSARGTINSAGPDIVESAGSVLNTPGANLAYIIHLHPSGDPNLSREDKQYHSRIARFLPVKTVTMVIAGRKYGVYTTENPEDLQGAFRERRIKPTLKAGGVPILKSFLLQGNVGSKISNPSEAIAEMQDIPAGYLITNSRNEIIAKKAVNVDGMDIDEIGRSIIKTLDAEGGPSIIIKVRQQSTVSKIQAAAHSIPGDTARILDVLVKRENPQPGETPFYSLADHGITLQEEPAEYQGLSEESFLQYGISDEERQQIARIAKDKKLSPRQVNSIMRVFTGRKKISDLTTEEANVLIDMLNGVIESRSGKPPHIPKSTAIIKADFFDKEVKKVGLSQLFFEPWYMFKRIGIWDEVGKPLYEADEQARINTADKFYKLKDWQNEAFKGIHHRQRAEVSRRIWEIADGTISPEELTKARPVEKEIAEEWRGMAEEYADKLGIPMEEREPAYISHIVEDLFRELLKSKYPFPEELSAIMQYIHTKAVFDPFLEKRLGFPIVKKDFFLSASRYIAAAEKKIAYDSALSQVNAYITPAPGKKLLPASVIEYVENVVNHAFLRRPFKSEKAFRQTWAGVLEKLPPRKVQLPPEVAAIVGQSEISVPRTPSGRPATKLISKVKELNYLSVIAGNVRTMMVNLTQPITAFAKLQGMPHQTIADMLYGYSKATTRIFRPSYWEAFEKAGLLPNIEGLLEDPDMHIKHRMAFKDLLFWNMQVSEFMNRVATAYAGARNKMRTDSFDELMQIRPDLKKKAEWINKNLSDTINFKYGPLYRPPWTLSPLGQVAYHLNSFNMKQAQLIYDMAKKLKVETLPKDFMKDPAGTLKDLTEKERGELVRYLLAATLLASLMGAGLQLSINLMGKFGILDVRPSQNPLWNLFTALVTLDVDRLKKMSKQFIPYRSAVMRGKRIMEEGPKGMLELGKPKKKEIILP